MRSLIALGLMILLLGIASSALAQSIVTYYPTSVPVTTYYAPTTTLVKVPLKSSVTRI